MNTDKNTSRRTFFLQTGAVVGAGVAAVAGTSAAGAAGPSSVDDARQALQQLEDREAIRQVLRAFTAHVENRQYAAAADLFAARAMPDLHEGRGAGAFHSAYRSNNVHHQDVVTIDGDKASATCHMDVAVGTALLGDSTVAQMARLQGNLADLRWETGRLDAALVKQRGEWKLAALHYSAA